MKKLLLYSVLCIFCFSFILGQNNYKSNNSVNNSESKLSIGWVMKLAPDTENFVNVFFKTENLGCIFTGNFPVKRTTDGGNTWGYGTVPYLTGTNSGVYFNGSDIFMAGYNIIPPLGSTGILFRSSNMGVNWDTAHYSGDEQGHTPYHYVHGMFKNIGYMTISWYTFPYYKTTNGGYNWFGQMINPTPGNFVSPDCISYVDTNIIYGISNYYHSIGKCVTGITNDHFVIIKDGIFSRICVVDSSNILAISNVKFFRSTDAGVNWDSTTYSVTLNSISFPDQNTGYMTGSNGKIFKSTNKGTTWITQITPTTDNLVDCCFLNTLTGYVIGANGTLLKTNDGGNTTVFTVSGLARYSDNNQPVTSGWVKAIKLDKGTGGVIIVDSAAIQSNGSYTLNKVPQDSVDIGIYPNSTPPNDWVITYYPSTTYWEHAVTLYPTGNLTNINIGAIRMNASTNNNSVNGKVMRLTNSPLGNLKDAVLYARSGNTFVRCTMSDGNGVYHLNSLPTGSLKIIVNRLGFTSDSATVNVTSVSNIDSINFYLNRVYVGVKKVEGNIPSEYKLYQNYPNPFNSMTNVKWQMLNAGNVRIILYDILGKEVVTLVNEEQKPGVYEVKFDCSSLPSGIYFYKLQTENFTDTKRMVLIK